MASTQESIAGLTMVAHTVVIFYFYRYYLRKEPLSFWSKIILFLKGMVVSDLLAIIWMAILDDPQKLHGYDLLSILMFTAGVLGISIIPTVLAFLLYRKYKSPENP
jgi:hypothetical protein